MKLLRSFFAGIVMAAFAASALASLDGIIESETPNNPTLPKTVVSATLRLVFTVGLEGTGHHYIVEVAKHLFKTRKLARISRHDSINIDAYQIDHSMGRSAQHYNQTLISMRDNMRSLAHRGATLPAPGTISFPRGRNSYPNGFGPNKALKYVDLRMLAEMAEEEGVDLRLLYLRRPVKDIVIADTIHRKFQTDLHNPGRSTPEKDYMAYMQILLTDIAVLHSFLTELGPGFAVCLDFDRAGDVDQSALVADFLAPNAEVAETLKDSFVAAAGAHAKSNEPLLYEGAELISARLQRKFDAFETQLCSGT